MQYSKKNERTSFEELQAIKAQLHELFPSLTRIKVKRYYKTKITVRAEQLHKNVVLRSGRDQVIPKFLEVYQNYFAA